MAEKGERMSGQGELISRDAAIEAIAEQIGRMHDTPKEAWLGAGKMWLEKVPSVQTETKRCEWCNSKYRIEYYQIDEEGNTASFQDKDRHLVATGIAKYCSCCGSRMESEAANE